MPPTSDLLHWINQQHATAFVLLDRFTRGEQGAFALVDAKDDRFVLKWAPDLSMLVRFQRARQVTDQLRALGYPAPEYVLVGCTADAAYAIQRALPGQPMQQLPQALISEFLTLNERQAEQARSEATTWPEPIVDPVLCGGDGFCLLEPMQAYSRTTAQMLQAVQAILQRYAGQIAPQADIVHYDCNPANVLASATSITGVIDWDGWCAGDRMFDVATMLFYSYADPAVRTSLWQTILKHSGPERGAV
jgi:Phosphotransferase enzyme family